MKQEIKVGDYVVCTCGSDSCPSGVVLKIDTDDIVWVGEGSFERILIENCRKLTKLELALK